MRGGFGVRGGVVGAGGRGEGEVWSLPGPRRHTALGSTAGRFSPMVPMPLLLSVQSKQSSTLHGRIVATIQFVPTTHHDFLLGLISNITAVFSAASRQFHHYPRLRRQRFPPPLQSPPNNTSTSHRI